MAQEIADSKLIDTWGSGGLVVKPDISKIIEGWQFGEQPPHEYMNWLQNTFGSKLNHILKNGVVKWNNETEYLAGATTQHSGNVWLCETTNTNSEPTELNANWKKVAISKDLTVTVDTLSDLRSISYPANTVWASGYHTKNDGAFGSHIFRLKGVKTIETDNSGTVIVATIGGVDYVYELQYDGAVNVKWFGAKGDGITDDTAVIQNVFDLFTLKKIIVPKGTYLVNNLKIYAFMNIYGDGSGKTIFGAFNSLLPVLIHGGQNNMLDTTLRGFSVSGGTYGIKFDVVESVNNLWMEDVIISGQSSLAMSINNPSINTFTKVWFTSSVNGLGISGGYANLNTFNECHFVAMSGYYIKSSASYIEVMNFNNCRFEGNGGVIPEDEENHQYHLEFRAPNALSFNNCYFERNHINTYKELNSNNSTIFSSCHFTGAYGNPTGFRANGFNTYINAANIGAITFNHCDAGVGTAGIIRPIVLNGCSNMFSTMERYTKYIGYKNTGLQLSEAGSGFGELELSSRVVRGYPVGNTLPVLKLNRITIDASSNNFPVISGVLTVNFSCRITGGFSNVYSVNFLILSSGYSTNAMTASATKINDIGALSYGDNITVTFSGAAKGEITVSINFTGTLVPNITNEPLLHWSFEGISSYDNGSDLITATSEIN